VKADIEEATRNKDDAKRKQAEAEYRELNLYKTVLFEELKDRLDKLPRPAQREKYEAKSKNFKWKDRPIGKTAAESTDARKPASPKDVDKPASEKKRETSSSGKKTDNPAGDKG
jgi:hypothetical protein